MKPFAWTVGCLTIALAQTCGFGQSFPNRWEGLKAEFNAKPRFQVRGVFAADDVAGATQNSVLKVSYFVPPNAAVHDALAWELHDVMNYQMRPNADQISQRPGAWATFAPWPVRDVLAPHGITPASVGILIRLSAPPTPEFFAPALLYFDRAPKQISAYSVFLTSDAPVVHIRCTVRDKDGKTSGSNGIAYPCQLGAGERTLAQGLPGRFNITAAGLPVGLVSVTIIGDYADDESGARLRAEIHFFHQPVVNLP